MAGGADAWRGPPLPNPTPGPDPPPPRHLSRRGLERRSTSYCRPQYDVAVLTTGTDLYVAGDDIIGVAYVGTACTDAGAAVSEERTSTTSAALLIAHEIGHTLGAVHDLAPPNTPCAAGAFIMSPTAVRWWRHPPSAQGRRRRCLRPPRPASPHDQAPSANGSQEPHAVWSNCSASAINAFVRTDFGVPAFCGTTQLPPTPPSVAPAPSSGASASERSPRWHAPARLGCGGLFAVIALALSY